MSRLSILLSLTALLFAAPVQASHTHSHSKSSTRTPPKSRPKVVIPKPTVRLRPIVSAKSISPKIVSSTKKLPAAPIKISGAFVQALPPGTANGSVYLSITNTSKSTIRLTGGTSNVSSSVIPMQQAKMDGMAGMTGMKDLPAMSIAAGQILILSPGSDHLMLYRMTHVPQVGELVSLTLSFTGYAPLTLKVPVKRL